MDEEFVVGGRLVRQRIRGARDVRYAQRMDKPKWKGLINALLKRGAFDIMGR
jgi:hypothetical protein